MLTRPTQSYHNRAYMSLMKGLKKLDLRGCSIPCDLVLTGDHAFPLAINSQGQVLMAASLFGRGRVVVLSHEAYLTIFPALVENALTWLRGDGSDNLSVGVQQNSKAVADNLSKSSFQAKVVEAFSDKLGVGVYVTDAYSMGADVKELVAFLKAGGGVLIAGQARHWASTHPKENSVLQFPGNVCVKNVMQFAFCGVTTAADWSLLRTAPAPWAELEFENIILTVPSDAVRSLDHPDELAAFWDEIMRAIADLAVIPHKFRRKERFVTDVQISAGWMHAGYPIMAHHATAAELVNIDCAKKTGLWGPIHELGHNQQRSCWEFPPHTTECTCNLWSVYVHEEVLGIDRAKAHPNMTVANRNRRAEKYVKAGKKLRDWFMSVALETYLQLQEKFGWDAFKKVFAAYHKMSNFPYDNEGKMNLYAETFSQAVGMNLCGFFKSWGWPIDTATEEKLSKLPPWSDHPMVQYS